jgi:hypothetical protein
MSVTGTGIDAGTTVTSVSATSVGLSKATTLAVAAGATITYGGGTAGVSVIAPTAGTALPAITLGTATDANASLVVSNAASVAGTSAAQADISGFEDTTAVTVASVGGAKPPWAK